jgi:hypothetical protein
MQIPDNETMSGKPESQPSTTKCVPNKLSQLKWKPRGPQGRASSESHCKILGWEWSSCWFWPPEQLRTSTNLTGALSSIWFLDCSFCAQLQNCALPRSPIWLTAPRKLGGQIGTNFELSRAQQHHVLKQGDPINEPKIIKDPSLQGCSIGNLLAQPYIVRNPSAQPCIIWNPYACSWIPDGT